MKNETKEKHIDNALATYFYLMDALRQAEVKTVEKVFIWNDDQIDTDGW
jgi:hypothetical protein